jgi:hypothetical protein
VGVNASCAEATSGIIRDNRSIICGNIAGITHLTLEKYGQNTLFASDIWG